MIFRKWFTTTDIVGALSPYKPECSKDLASTYSTSGDHRDSFREDDSSVMCSHFIRGAAPGLQGYYTFQTGTGCGRRAENIHIIEVQIGVTTIICR